MKVFFSVIIPTLNEEHYLPNLLDSLKAQTYRDFEVIIVDGNSEDGTKSVAQKHKPTDKFSFYTVKKRSVSFQRNYGASKAKGTYLVFTDADSTLAPDFFEKVHLKAIMTKDPMLYPAMKVNAGPLERGFTSISNFYIDLFKNWNISAVPVGICIIAREVFKKVGGYRGEEYQLRHVLFPEDQEIASRVRTAGYKPSFVKSARVVISMRRFRKDGVVSTYLSYIYNMIMISFRKYLRLAPLKTRYEQGGHVYKRRFVDK